MKLVPGKGLVKATPTDSAFASGALVFYENDGAGLLAAIIAFRKQKYAVLNERGRELELQAIRLHAVPGHLPHDISSTDAKVAYLSEFRSKAETVAESLNLEELWETIHREEREYTNIELCELYFNDRTPAHYLGIRLALLADKTFFKRHKENFLPRLPEVVEQLKKAEIVRLEKLKTQELFVSTCKNRIKNPGASFPKEIRSHLQLLEEVAAGAAHLDNAHHREAKDLVDLCAESLRLELNGSREQRAFQLLEHIQHFTPNTNLAFIRHRIPLEFPDEVLKEGHALTLPRTVADWYTHEGLHPPALGARVDLTQLECMTIDDTSTRDMDDALSIEEMGSGYRLGVHISDVTTCIAPHSLLDAEAKYRATSIYLPERTIHMLPPQLSEQKASLVQGEIRPAISCLFEVDSSFEVKSGVVVPSIIRVNKRYSYDQVDTMLEGDSRVLQMLYEIGVNHEQRRMAQGAMKVYKRDLLISINDQQQPVLNEIDEHGPARGLVGEMMVLANSLLATYAMEHSLPVVFRLQDAPEPIEETIVPDGPAADYKARSQLKKSTVSLKPGLHAGLGLHAYIQVTSPIRRYIDLCNQRQILAHLRTGKSFYSESEFERILQETEETLGAAASVTKETKRFWLLRYLELRLKRLIPCEGSPQLIKGTVLRTNLKNPLVELEEVFLPVLAKIAYPVKPGDILTLKIASIDPRQDYLRLESV